MGWVDLDQHQIRKGRQRTGNLIRTSRIALQMMLDVVFSPELRLVDGTVIRSRQEAIAFARAQEARPGVDERDEILHLLERAAKPEEVEFAAQRFRSWMAQLELLDHR